MGRIFDILKVVLVISFISVQVRAAPLGDLLGRTVVSVELDGAQKAGLSKSEGLGYIVVMPGDRFSISSVRRSLKLLYHLGLFGQIKVTAKKVKGGLELVFHFEKKHKVVSISILGCEHIDKDDLLRLSRLSRGREFDHWRMEAGARDMASLYRRRGFRQVRVVSKAEDLPGSNVAVEHFIQEGPPTRISKLVFLRTNKVFSDEKLSSILGLERGDILDEQKLDAGLEALRVFFFKNGYLEARIQGPTLDFSSTSNWKQLSINIEHGYKVKVEFEGNHTLGSKRLLNCLELDKGVKLTDFVLADMRDRIRSEYMRAGHTRATVSYRLFVEKSRGLKIVRFYIHEGPMVQVQKVEFVGNKFFSDEKLRGYIFDAVADEIPQPGLAQRVDPGDLDPLGGADKGIRPVDIAQGYWFDLVPEKIFLPDAYAKAVNAIEDLYLSQGFLDVKIENPVLYYDDSGSRLFVTIPIEEGRQTMLESISFAGNHAIEAGSLLAVAGQLDRFIRPGGPLDQYGLELLRKKLLSTYAQRGYVYCNLEQEVTFSKDRTLASVVFDIEEGPLVHVGRVIVRGDILTDSRIFRALVLLKPGDVFSPDEVRESEENLLQLGLFDGVNIKMLDPDNTSDIKDVVVDVTERLSHHITVRPGLSSAEGVRMLVEYVQRNLFGFALESLTRAKINYQVFYPTPIVPKSLGERFSQMSFAEGLEWNLMSGLHLPKMWFIHGDPAGRLDVVGLRDHALSFDLTKVSVTAGMDFRLSRNLSFSVDYGVEYIDLTCPFKGSTSGVDTGPCGETPDRWQRYDEGQLPLGSFRPEMSWDRRDNPFNPHVGLLAFLRSEFAHSFSPIRPVYYIKLDGQLSGYLPLSRRTTLAVSFRGGGIFHLTSDSTTPSHKLFYLGGRNSMRGFEEDNLIPQDQSEACFCDERDENGTCIGRTRCVSQGGNAYLNFKTELRFPLMGSFLFGALFFDLGNLWVNMDSVNLLDMRPAVGFGLRLATPIGPLALDAGFNLSPDSSRGESLWNLHFNVGVF